MSAESQNSSGQQRSVEIKEWLVYDRKGNERIVYATEKFIQHCRYRNVVCIGNAKTYVISDTDTSNQRSYDQ